MGAYIWHEPIFVLELESQRFVPDRGRLGYKFDWIAGYWRVGPDWDQGEDIQNIQEGNHESLRACL